MALVIARCEFVNWLHHCSLEEKCVIHIKFGMNCEGQFALATSFLSSRKHICVISEETFPFFGSWIFHLVDHFHKKIVASVLRP